MRGRVKVIDGARYFELGKDFPLDSDAYGSGNSPTWIRWGDQNVFELVVPPGGADSGLSVSRQLLRVDYKMPTTWTMRTVYDVQPLPDETASFIIQRTVTIGVGSAQATIKTRTVIAPVAGIYPQVIIDEVFPAQQVNAMVAANIASNSVTGGKEYVTATLLIAPRVF